MSLPHLAPGEVVDLLCGPANNIPHSHALLRTDKLEVMRLLIRPEKAFPEHHVDGECLIQCVQGEVKLHMDGQQQDLSAGQLVYLQPKARHALTSASEALVLVVLLRNQEAGASTPAKG